MPEQPEFTGRPILQRVAKGSGVAGPHANLSVGGKAKADSAWSEQKRTRGKRDALAADFTRMGQHPDDYVCNCGPTSAGADPRLDAAVA